MLSLRVEENRIILEPNDAVLLSLKGRKFARISPEEVERISREEQGRYEGAH